MLICCLCKWMSAFIQVWGRYWSSTVPLEESCENLSKDCEWGKVSKGLSCHDFPSRGAEKGAGLGCVAVQKVRVLLVCGESCLVCVSPCPLLPLCWRSDENEIWYYFWACKYSLKKKKSWTNDIYWYTIYWDTVGCRVIFKPEPLNSVKLCILQEWYFPESVVTWIFSSSKLWGLSQISDIL